MTATRLIWHERGPWKRIEVSRDAVLHNWPMEHEDTVLGVVAYRVPPEMVGDLARFDGSVGVDRTKGELWVRCADEEANLLTINLAHEIVTGRRGVEEAREEYARNMQRKQEGETGPSMMALQFKLEQRDTGDTDVPTLDKTGRRIREERDVLTARR